MDLSKFDLSKKIVHELNEIVEHTGIPYMDAIIDYSEKTGIELEVIADVVRRNEAIKSRVEIEAEQLNLLKSKVNRLPL